MPNPDSSINALTLNQVAEMLMPYALTLTQVADMPYAWILTQVKYLNPTPVGGGGDYSTISSVHWKISITPKNNDPNEPKFCDFSNISMG